MGDYKLMHLYLLIALLIVLTEHSVISADIH